MVDKEDRLRARERREILLQHRHLKEAPEERGPLRQTTAAVVVAALLLLVRRQPLQRRARVALVRRQALAARL